MAAVEDVCDEERGGSADARDVRRSATGVRPYSAQRSSYRCIRQGLKPVYRAERLRYRDRQGIRRATQTSGTAMRRSEVLAEHTVQCVKQALNRLQDFWDDVGIPEEHRIERADLIRVHIKSLLDGMIAEEEDFKKRLLSDIEIFHKQVDTLCQELNLPLFKKEAGKTMLQLEKDLRTRRDVLSKQKNERLAELKILQARDQELCHILCEPLYSIDYSVVPSLDNLDHFRRHLIALAGVKIIDSLCDHIISRARSCVCNPSHWEYRRKVEFVNTQAQIRLCMEELDRVPVTSFEREVLDEHIEFFCLSAENIADLQLLLVQLEEQKAQNEAVCVQLRSRITELWNRLQVPAEKRDAFCIDVAGSKSKTRIKLEAELERLEKLKHEYLQYVTQGIRKEMLSYWDMCLYSNLQRQAFSPFYDENFTENLLSLHNDEIMRLKHHYEVHKELFEGVKKWKKSWKRFLEYEKRASNPYRFAYQDCNLVKEEQEHAELQKTLSQLEEELKVHIDAWEQTQQQGFLVNGQKFMDYVSAQWKMLHDKKEKEKLERVRKLIDNPPGHPTVPSMELFIDGEIYNVDTRYGMLLYMLDVMPFYIVINPDADIQADT